MMRLPHGVVSWEDHTEGHDGTIDPSCQICNLIAEFPCQWCGYGAMFYTHNLLAHSENGDPICQEDGFGEHNFEDRMLVEPWRDWATVFQLEGSG